MSRDGQDRFQRQIPGRVAAVLVLALGITVLTGGLAIAQQGVIDLGAGQDDTAPAPNTDALPPPDNAPPDNAPPAAPLTDVAPPNQAGEPAGTPIPPSPNRIANPVAVFAGLDKITGRITSFDVYIDETVQFGSLQVTPRVCYTRPPTDVPRTDAFVQVDEIGLDRKVRRIFSGWMFADSPGLHAVDNPVYDVWLTDCKTSSPVAPPGNR
jgi:hypothetical protein